jgi:hypothetical protein
MGCACLLNRHCVFISAGVPGALWSILAPALRFRHRYVQLFGWAACAWYGWGTIPCHGRWSAWTLLFLRIFYMPLFIGVFSACSVYMTKVQALSVLDNRCFAFVLMRSAFYPLFNFLIPTGLEKNKIWLFKINSRTRISSSYIQMSAYDNYRCSMLRLPRRVLSAVSFMLTCKIWCAMRKHCL